MLKGFLVLIRIAHRAQRIAGFPGIEGLARIAVPAD